MYNKFGFCKFKDMCRKPHVMEICQDSSCKAIKSCSKRHPKVCKRFAAENECKFGIECSYQHIKSVKCIEQNKLKEKVEEMEKKMEELDIKVVNSEMKDKVKLLEAVVQKMFVNIIQLEAKVNELKTVIKDKDMIEEASGKDDILEAEYKSNQEKQIKTKQNIINKCDKCNYSCKKINMMKEHMETKHSDFKCKACKEKFSSANNLLQHIADKHSMKPVQSECVKSKDDKRIEDVKIFECPKCNELISKDDKLNYPKEKGQQWCGLCTILSYGEKEYGLVQP